jgi:hypothetical protein
MLDVLTDWLAASVIAGGFTFGLYVLCCLAFDDDGWIEDGSTGDDRAVDTRAEST